MPPHPEQVPPEPALPRWGWSAVASSAGRGLVWGLGLFLVLAQLRAWLGQPLADSPLPQLTASSESWFSGLLGLELLIAAHSARPLWLRSTGLLLLALGAVQLLGEPQHELRALVLGVMALVLLAPHTPAHLHWPAAVAALLIGALAWPLILILEAGTLGPKAGQPAFDAVIVLGAGTYADGQPSLVLTDRVRTGCQLLSSTQSHAQLVLSGGPGAGEVHETEAMAALCTGFRIPTEQLLLDPSGLNSSATASRAAELAQEQGWNSVVAVSHAYHLPRLRQSFLDAGLAARTVAAVESARLERRAWYVTREVVAWWAYWLRGFSATRAG